MMNSINKLKNNVGKMVLLSRHYNENEWSKPHPYKILRVVKAKDVSSSVEFYMVRIQEEYSNYPTWCRADELFINAELEDTGLDDAELDDE